jgi:hypothetical protein
MAPYLVTVMLEAVSTCETSVYFYKAAQHHIQKSLVALFVVVIDWSIYGKKIS